MIWKHCNVYNDLSPGTRSCVKPDTFIPQIPSATLDMHFFLYQMVPDEAHWIGKKKNDQSCKCNHTDTYTTQQKETLDDPGSLPLSNVSGWTTVAMSAAVRNKVMELQHLKQLGTSA
ncbi:hypothetical protein EOD39_12188 [Acipenser ruthenus]|uniref:Uncharacterized protein n=1 Tax=Acipenser ruthenus TaxID=7906 RepID=A0A444TW86_ACIRT|nr:hypothetical protein EOD39_12188 [Acipenser ruthenus]